MISRKTNEADGEPRSACALLEGRELRKIKGSGYGRHPEGTGCNRYTELERKILRVLDKHFPRANECSFRVKTKTENKTKQKILVSSWHKPKLMGK